MKTLLRTGPAVHRDRPGALRGAVRRVGGAAGAARPQPSALQDRATARASGRLGRARRIARDAAGLRRLQRRPRARQRAAHRAARRARAPGRSTTASCSSTSCSATARASCSTSSTRSRSTRAPGTKSVSPTPSCCGARPGIRPSRRSSRATCATRASSRRRCSTTPAASRRSTTASASSATSGKARRSSSAAGGPSSSATSKRIAYLYPHGTAPDALAKYLGEFAVAAGAGPRARRAGVDRQDAAAGGVSAPVARRSGFRRGPGTRDWRPTARATPTSPPRSTTRACTSIPTTSTAPG